MHVMLLKAGEYYGFWITSEIVSHPFVYQVLPGVPHFHCTIQQNLLLLPCALALSSISCAMNAKANIRSHKMKVYHQAPVYLHQVTL